MVRGLGVRHPTEAEAVFRQLGNLLTEMEAFAPRLDLYREERVTFTNPAGVQLAGSLFLPSGLAVYMLTSYLFGIVQQLYVNYLDRKGKITL